MAIIWMSLKSLTKVSKISKVFAFPSPNSPPPKNRIVFLLFCKLNSSKISCLLYFCKNLDEIGIPVKYVGLGESVDDLQTFDPEKFVYGLFKGLVEE